MSRFLLPPQSQMSSHRRGRLVTASSGLALVATAHGTWALPPLGALWMPPGVRHRLSPSAAVPWRRLIIGPGMATQLSPEPYVFVVSPLLRQAILRLSILIGEAPAEAPRRRLLAVIMDEILAAEPAPWFLPRPRERRLAKVTRALVKDPADNRRLEAFSSLAGASPRTLARLFVAHTGLTFGAWRQRLRLLTAMTLLQEGMPVETVATKTGFAGPSAFIAAFKRSTGQSPGRYFRPV